MPLPPAHLLMGVAAAEVVRTAAPLPRYRTWAVAAGLALLPDIDYGIRIVVGAWAPLERSATHSLAATLLVALLAWLMAGGRWAAVAGAGYGSHLLADLLQNQERTSVALFWPWQERGMEPLFPLFPRVTFERGEGVRGAALSLFEPPHVYALLLETAIAAAIFAGVFLICHTVRRARGSRQPRRGRLTHPSAGGPR
jgi:membrane-bound metal-dependent hydrolase YbcI (DUF457 family)